MLYSFDINTDTLASLIRYGIVKGKVCASSRKYLETFLQLVYDHIAEIKLYKERNYHVTLHSVMGTGIVYKIYAAINNAKDTFKPFEVVPYDVSESDFVSYALQTLQHT